VKKVPTLFPDVWIIEPDVFKDPRGWFFESYSQKKMKDLGFDTVFVQDNHSSSTKNTVRGLHFQARPGQVKLVRCTRGRIWDIVADIRPNSPTFRKWTGVELTEENFRQLFIPVGYAHGFTVLSDVAEVQYKASNFYDGKIERGVSWNDKTIGVDWKVQEPVLSQRDLSNVSLDDYLKKYPDPFTP
jgi:dTDP-4-dehydrorhamnose 3,5-epimerase